MRLGHRLIKEQLFFRKELMERVDWFIRLRWFFAAAGLAGCAFLHLIHPRAPVSKLVAVLLTILLYNGLFVWISRWLRGKETRPPEPFIRFAHVQISLDLAALFVLIDLTGGLSSPLCFFAIFHLILAGILLSAASCYLYGAVILVAVGLMTLARTLNSTTVSPVLFHLPGVQAEPAAAQNLFNFLTYAAAVLVTVVLTTSIKKSLRAKGRELLHVSRELSISNEKLKALYEMVKTLGRCSDLQTLMDTATGNAAAIMGVKGCSIKLLDEHRRRLRFASTHGLSGDYLAKAGVDIRESAVNRGIIEGMAHVVGDIEDRDQFQYPEDVEREGIAAMVCLPLKVERMIFGVFCVYSGIPDFFKPGDVLFFELVSDLTALAMENLKSELNKTWFLHKAAHQLRSPLNTVFSVLKTMRDGYLGPVNPRQKNILARCERRLALLRSMLADLLEISIRRAHPDKTPLEPMDLADVIASHLPAFRIQAAEKNIDLSMTAAPHLPRVAASETLLDDLLINLISNALKYTPAGGKVWIEVDTDDQGRLRCSIRDTGIGIPAAHQAGLFSEFYRAPNAREFTEEGTGLGLVIVKEILDHLQGTIRINSAEGEGTHAVVLLPALGPKDSCGSADSP